MNKAEERATERYKNEPCNIDTQNKHAAFVDGYHQAEKDIMKKVYCFLNGYSFIPTYVINDLKQAIKDEQG